MNAPAYNFAYLDEQTKRMIRRAILTRDQIVYGPAATEADL